MAGKPPPPRPRVDMPPLPNLGKAASLDSSPLAAGSPIGPKVFQCPNCGAQVAIRAQGSTISVACKSCASVIDVKDENYQILSKAALNLKIEPLIPLGQRGIFHGVLWEVIGFMQRCDGSGMYSWREYLLFNPTRGFRWLTEFDGHWNYVVTTKEKPTASISSAISSYGRNTTHYMGKHYSLFHRGTAKVTYVVGEFYWRVKVGDTVDVEDYISPPEILSCEKSKEEVVWSIGEYVNADDIRSAFQIKSPMPVQSGVAPNQPSSFSSPNNSINGAWGVLIAILFMIQMFSMARARNEEVYRGDFIYNQGDLQKVKTSPQFELKGGLANVEFKLSSPVQNNWLEIAVDVVNDQTGETYEFEQGVEYYSGYDSDGSWSEGSQNSGIVLSSIPDGLYHLNIEASGPTNYSWSASTPPSDQSYSIAVVRDVGAWSNFFWSIFLVSIFPAFVWWRSRIFELTRWSTSDFSPYWSQQGDDE